MASSSRTTWNFFMVSLLKMDKQGMTGTSADLAKAPKVPGHAAEPKSGPAAPIARDLELGRRKRYVARTALSQLDVAPSRFIPASTDILHTHIWTPQNLI